MSFMTASGKRLVPPTGDPRSKIAIVGEAPGREEEQRLQCFVGQTGMLLDRLLTTAKLTRSEIYFNNVVKERPPDNKVSVFINSTKKYGIRAKPKYYGYEAQLKEELDACDANIIIACGNVSLYALTREWGILKRRGSIYKSTLLEYRNGQPRKVIACIHPAAALRAYSDIQYFYRHYIIFDLNRARKQSHTPDFPYPERSFVIHPTFERTMQYLTDIKDNYDQVAFDIETMLERIRRDTGLSKTYKDVVRSISQIGFAKTPYDAISIPFWMDNHNYWDERQELEIIKIISDIMYDKRKEKIAQNVMYDTSVMFRLLGIIPHNLHDTMIMQRIANPDLPARLEFLTSVNTFEPYYKDEREGHLYKHNPSKSIYNAKDCAVTFEVFNVLKGDIARHNNQQTYERQRSIVEPLLYMGEMGIRVDTEGMAQASKEAKAEIDGIEEQINRLCYSEGYKKPLNPRSSKQCQEYFYDFLGHPPYKSRKKGSSGATADKVAMQRLARKRKTGWKEAELVLKARELTKLRGTYYECRLLNGRFHFQGKPVGTIGGRISTATDNFGYGSNAQNSPWRFLKYLIADDGYVYYELDKGQAENRIVAYSAPDANMIEAFEQGEDVHSKTAAFIFGIPIEEVSDEPGTSGIGDWSQRKAGKTCNHALNYLMGEEKFSLEYMIPIADARFLRNRWMQLYYGVPEWWNAVEDQLRRQRTLTNCWPFERTRLFMGKMDRDLVKEGANWIPQSTVADLINEWGLIHVFYNDSYKGVRLHRQVHDSITIAVRLDLGWRRHAEILSSIRDSLDQPLRCSNREFVIPTDCAMGLNLCKDSEPGNPNDPWDMRKIKLNGTVPEIEQSLKDNWPKLKRPSIWKSVSK